MRLSKLVANSRSLSDTEGHAVEYIRRCAVIILMVAIGSIYQSKIYTQIYPITRHSEICSVELRTKFNSNKVKGHNI
jgi:hypothetical protein